MFRILSIGLVAILASACSSAGSSATPAVSSPSAAAVVTTAPTVAPSATPTASPDACAAANLTLIAPGKLTIATDNPAFPPYFSENADGHKTDPWELGDPTNGQGFESAVAYAVAAKLGFTKDQVAWIYVPFDNSYKPGPKTFDFDINEVSFTPERAQVVDMTDGYYFVNQAVAALATNPIAKVTTISGLAAFKLGAQVGTTSYSTITDVIKPTKDPSVYDTNDAAIAALKARQIDGIVDRPADGVLHGRRPAQERDRGRPVRPPGSQRRRGAFQPRPRQGQPTDGLPQRGDRRHDGRREPRRDHQGMAVGQGLGARLHAVARTPRPG